MFLCILYIFCLNQILIIYFLVVFRFVEIPLSHVWLFLILALLSLVSPGPQQRGVLPHLGRLQLGHGLDQGGEGEPGRWVVGSLQTGS